MEQNEEISQEKPDLKQAEIGVPQMPQDAPTAPQVSTPAPPPESAGEVHQAAPDFGGLQPDTGKGARNVRSMEEFGQVGEIIKALREKKVVGLNLTSLREFAVSLIFPAYTIQDPGAEFDGLFDLARFKNDFEAFQDTQKLDIHPIKLGSFDKK